MPKPFHCLQRGCGYPVGECSGACMTPAVVAPAAVVEPAAPVNPSWFGMGILLSVGMWCVVALLALAIFVIAGWL